MQPIVWNEKLSVGVKLFDEEHKQLISYINRLNNALEIRSTQKTMEEILTGLFDYTKSHFKDEEMAMIKYEYPDFTNHKIEHDKLTKQVYDFKDRLKTGKTSFSLELMQFLSDWLINHIQDTDMKYKPLLKDKDI